MFDKLLKQIFNEWRSNLWLLLELLVVSVVLWYVTDYLYTTASIASRPKGFDAENTFRISFDQLNSNSPEYEARPDSLVIADFSELLDRISRHPEVEAASLSVNSFPYNGSNSNRMIVSERYDSVPVYPLMRFITSDFVKVFRYTGANGESSERLAELLDEGKILVTDNLLAKTPANVEHMTELVGTRFYLDGDTTISMALGASITPVRYADYRTWSQCIVIPMDEADMRFANELCVRVKPEYTKGFADRFMAEADKNYRVGNLFIMGVESFDSIKEGFQLEETNSIRNYYVGMGFLLLNIFLGLLGTFWFRTQQRVREIAIREVCGSTRGQVFGRLIGEGLLLLAVVTPLALIIDINLANLEFNQRLDGYLEWGRLLNCAVITFLLMAVMISVGIAIPAWRAMKMQPVEALADE